MHGGQQRHLYLEVTKATQLNLRPAQMSRLMPDTVNLQLPVAAEAMDLGRNALLSVTTISSSILNPAPYAHRQVWLSLLIQEASFN